MIVGSAASPLFLEDYFEVEGDREPETDVQLGGQKDVDLIAGRFF